MNVERVYLVIRKEVVLLLRSKRMLLLALIVPSFMVALCSYAFVGEIKSVPIIVINEDKGPAGLALTNQLMRSDQISVKYFGNWETVQDATDLVRTGQYSAIVLIPYDFTNRLNLGQAYVLTYVDGADPVTGYTSSSAIISAVTQFHSTITVETDPDFLFNTNVGHASGSVQLNDLRFIIPGVIGVTLAALLTVLSSSSIVDEREIGSFEQLMVSPISGAELLMGKILYYVVFVGLINIVGTLFVTTLIFHIRIVGSILLVFLMLFIYVVASVGMGVFISVISKTTVQAGQTAINVITVEVFLSGMTYPIRAMPGLLRPLAYCLPLTYLGDGLRELMIRGSSFASVAGDFAAIIIYLVVAYVLAVRFFAKRID